LKEPLAVEPTQDAAIEKARKLEPDAAIRVERVRNGEGGGRDTAGDTNRCSIAAHADSRTTQLHDRRDQKV
jgi:hypothetical protein